MGSDAFFPFPDGIEEAAKAGIAAVIQPGGSIRFVCIRQENIYGFSSFLVLRDEDVVAKADELGLVMVFTGERHFKH